MRNFQDTFETRKRPIMSGFSICMTAPLRANLKVLVKVHIFDRATSRPKVFCRKGVFRNFAKFTRKRLCQSLFLIKLRALGLQLY